MSTSAHSLYDNHEEEDDGQFDDLHELDETPIDSSNSASVVAKMTQSLYDIRLATPPSAKTVAAVIQMNANGASPQHNRTSSYDTSSLKVPLRPPPPSLGPRRAGDDHVRSRVL